jgi:alkaline phosphatase D
MKATSRRVSPFLLVLLTAAATSAAPPRSVTDRPDVGVRPIGQREIHSRLLPVLISGQQVSGVLPGGQYFPQSIASGDPRPDSVVLWTRVDDPALAGADLPVRVIVTQDPFFQHVVMNQVVMAKAQYDHCVKLKVPGLQPRTSYLYFFVYGKGTTLYLSHLGHTKTAPSPDDNVPVRFAFFSCQDYPGNYYNVYAKLLLDHRDDLDFVAFIGDYIYETDAEPSSETPQPGRTIDFTDQAGTITLGDPAHPYHAASSLSNYRQLYKTYRSDPMLQQLHESFPMVAIWDDHEYANDCHGATATYFDGRKDETDVARRQRSEQAFFEYMPITPGLGPDGTLAIDSSILYPNARIYQDFRFGSNLELVLSDYRSFRPGPLVHENAFPGAVVMDRATLEAVLGPAVYQAVQASFDPYVAIDTMPAVQATVAAILSQLYLADNPFLSPVEAAAAAQSAASGNVSATYIDALFAGASLAPPFDEAALANFDRGLSVLLFGKRDLYSQQGSRYVLAKDSFDLYSQFLYATTGGASEDAFGQTQENWIKSAFTASDATWKVLASSTSMTTMVFDFTNPLIAAFLPPDFPALYRTKILIDADQWDGFPNRRAELLGFLSTIPGSVVISGDIHASFVADHRDGVYEFTGPAVSSQTILGEIEELVMATPDLSGVQGIDQVLAFTGPLLQLSSQDPAVSPSRIDFDSVDQHGCVVVEAGSGSMTATYYLMDSAQTRTNYYNDTAALNSLFTTTTFKVEGGALSQVP